MPQTQPWNSVKEQAHHNNSLCSHATSIPAQSQQRGTGNKPLCPECRKLKVLGR